MTAETSPKPDSPANPTEMIDVIIARLITATTPSTTTRINYGFPVQLSQAEAGVVLRALEHAVLDEREACARLADDDDGNFTWAGTDAGVVIRQQVAKEIAAAIRARSNRDDHNV